MLTISILERGTSCRFYVPFCTESGHACRFGISQLLNKPSKIKKPICATTRSKVLRMEWNSVVREAQSPVGPFDHFSTLKCKIRVAPAHTTGSLYRYAIL